MAKQQLPTNFKDDILATQMAGKRRYRIIQNDDGTVSLEDVTDYSRVGNDFGSAQINATNMAVNESFDKNKVIDSLDDIAANESAGYAAGALAVRELNGNIISVEHKDIGLHAVDAGSYTDIPVDLKQFEMSKIISVIPILQGRSSSPNYGLLTLGLYEFNQNTATLRVFNADGSKREPRINVCVIGFKRYNFSQPKS